MPIRFYCPFCEQLLGITRRKAGSGIRCPRCRGIVGVPTSDRVADLPPPPPLAVSAPPPPLARFENPDPVVGPRQIAVLALVLAGLLLAAFLAGLVVGALALPASSAFG